MGAKRDPLSDESKYDWKEISVTLAADNARLLGIAIVANKLAALVEDIVESRANSSWRLNLSKLLDEYKIASQGH